MKGDQIESCQSYIPDMLTSIMVPERVTGHLRPTGRPFIRDMYSCRRPKKGNKTKFSLLARFVARGAAEYSEVHLKSRHAKILEIEPRLTHF